MTMIGLTLILSTGIWWLGFIAAMLFAHRRRGRAARTEPGAQGGQQVRRQRRRDSRRHARRHDRGHGTRKAERRTSPPAPHSARLFLPEHLEGRRKVDRARAVDA